MIKLRKFLTAVILLPILFASSCSKEDPPAKISKSLFIYMAAENSLSNFVEDDLKELKQGIIPAYFESGKSGDVLLIYINTVDDNPKLYRFSKEKTGDINRELIKEYEEHNSLDESVMTSVLTYAANLFPAEYNGLVLWSHGTGWVPSGFYTKKYDEFFRKRQYSVDGTQIFPETAWDKYPAFVKSFGENVTGDDFYEMDIPNLAKALPIHYSFILFDACLMGGIEVAYELKDKTDYLISSSAEILGEGFPYQYVSSYFFRDGMAGLVDICRSYYEYYKDQGYGATVSLVNSSALVDLAEMCCNIFSTRRPLISTLNKDDIQGFFRYRIHYYYDLADFIYRITSSSQYTNFEKVMRNVVVAKYCTEIFSVGSPQFEIKKFSGLSTYIPDSKDKDLEYLNNFYKTLAWNKAVQMVQ